MVEVYEHALTVCEADIDSLGHVNNVVYIQWMQDAALAHSAALGWSAKRYRENGAGWVARLHQIEYLQPAYPGDRVVVRTWVAEMKKVTSTRQYRMVSVRDHDEAMKPQGDASEILLAIAHTHWAYIDFATRKLIRIPPEIAAAYRVVSPPSLGNQ